MDINELLNPGIKKKRVFQWNDPDKTQAIIVDCVTMEVCVIDAAEGDSSASIIRGLREKYPNAETLEEGCRFIIKRGGQILGPDGQPANR